MKPQDLYRGQAPAAMSMMGQGLMEAGANIGRSIQSGYQSLGQGLASGVEQAANAYQEKKKLDAQNKADASFAKAVLPYLPKERQAEVGGMLDALENDPNISPIQKAAQYHNWKSYLGQSIAHTMDMEKVREAAAYSPEWGKYDLEQQKIDEAKRKAEADAKAKAAALAGFAKSISGKPTSMPQPSSSIAPSQPQSNLQLPEKTGTELEDKTSFDNLDLINRQKIQNSKITPDIWNSYDSEHRAKLLSDPNNIIWNN